jgi:anti-sigma factor RsiW
MDNCIRIKELLVLYAEGVLEAAEADGVREHIASCTACKREVSEIEQIRQWLTDPEVFSRAP